jgi:hypothetical protein
MTQTFHISAGAPSWLAFELSVLRRLKFQSIAFPFTGEPHLGLSLKRWGYRVAANDPAPWSWVKALAFIENNANPLSEADVATVLEDAYVPGYKLAIPALREWFNETDAWWFDNVRRNIDRLELPTVRSLAMATALAVGDYALSFTEETRILRQPLSKIFRRIWQTQPPLVNNAQRNTSANQPSRDFTARQQTDLFFLRLPPPRNSRPVLHTWRDAWVSGPNAVPANNGQLRIETKQQYLHFVEDLLHTANHLPQWAISHVEDGFVSTKELAETVKQVRPVDTIYAKDLSELTGMRASIITA